MASKSQGLPRMALPVGVGLMSAASLGFCSPSTLMPISAASRDGLSSGKPIPGACRSAAAVVIGASMAVASFKVRPCKARSLRGVCCKAFEDELGVQPPLGYFDPLGLSKDGDFAEFYRRREAEIKNGRVAMYATIGYIIPEYFRWPGYLSPTEDLTFADCPNGLQALLKVPPEGWLQILAWCGMYEFLINQPKHPSEPGNYYKGRLGVLPGTMIVDPEKRKRSLNAELANGRLAMVAITWMWIQDGLHGKAWGEWNP
ncbi:unnamed protein product [Effrenium voratum]|nr:unnamed protein product [Effrenium voratum]CAJ1436219.1 unnamed protein product [Effrenium voratum]